MLQLYVNNLLVYALAVGAKRRPKKTTTTTTTTKKRIFLSFVQNFL